MKVLMCVAAVVALAVGFSLTSVAVADAGCRVGWRCNAAVLVPAPNPIPLRRMRPRVVAPAPCVAPCGRRAVVVAPAPCVAPCGGRPVAVAPAPCVAPCGLPPGPTAYRYRAPNYYAYYKQPAYAGECGLSSCNTYWRRNCWYDSFGRRFCN